MEPEADSIKKEGMGAIGNKNHTDDRSTILTLHPCRNIAGMISNDMDILQIGFKVREELWH